MNETMMMHGMRYAGQDVSGWIATEKLDGVRAYWDGETMWTRGGKRIITPAHWALPDGIHLDGELFAGYGNRQLAVNAARYGRWDDRVRFVAFDAPYTKGNYDQAKYHDRYLYAHKVWNFKKNGSVILSASRFIVESIESLNRELAKIKWRGGEGIMVRHTELVYMPGRTDLMLKIK